MDRFTNERHFHTKGHNNLPRLINDFPIPIPYAYTSSYILIVDRLTNERYSYTKETIHLPRLARLLVNTDWFVQLRFQNKSANFQA